MYVTKTASTDYSVFMTLPDWKDRVAENTMADIQIFTTGCIEKISEF